MSFIQCSALNGGHRVVGFVGKEAISKPFRFEVTVALLQPEPLQAVDVLGQQATLAIQGADSHKTHAVVDELILVSAWDQTQLYQIGLSPRLARLKLSRHSRVFVDMSIVDIITQTLNEGGVTEHEWRLQGEYPSLPHVCQYKETDFNFVSRWLWAEPLNERCLSTERPGTGSWHPGSRIG